MPRRALFASLLFLLAFSFSPAAKATPHIQCEDVPNFTGNSWGEWICDVVEDSELDHDNFLWSQFPVFRGQFLTANNNGIVVFSTGQALEHVGVVGVRCKVNKTGPIQVSVEIGPPPITIPFSKTVSCYHREY
jgi:hypothetical protein